MLPEVYEYIASKQVIHDNLLERCERLIAKYRELWAQGDKAEPAIFTWPSEVLHADDSGTPVNDICCCKLDADRNKWPDTIRGVAERTKAFAVLVMDPRETEVRFLFESPKGTRAWTIPIQRHGDVSVLGKVRREDGAARTGLLWKTN